MSEGTVGYFTSTARAISNRLRCTVPNLSTVLAITVFTPALAGCLLLLSWLQHRSIIALALWGAGFITAFDRDDAYHCRSRYNP